MKAYIDMFKHYADFNGRTNRSDFWFAVLGNVIIQGVLGIIANMMEMPIILSLYSLLIFIPYLSIGVRRLHDVGKRWTYCLWLLVPVVGWIILVVQYCKPSANIY